MNSPRSIVVLGAGLFGLTTGLELARRGWQVTVVDLGPVPRPLAASTDISKAVRMDYGEDELYTRLMERALPRWRAWNQEWQETVYHEDGFLFLSREPLRPGGFEFASHRYLSQRGHRLERIGPAELRSRHPAWQADRYPDGYFNPAAGWAASGRVIARLAQQAQAAGIRLETGRSFAGFIEHGSRITGVRLAPDESLAADRVLLAVGAWTPELLPELQTVLWASGQPVFHFQAPERADFSAPRFPVWAADIARTGWYGFPALPDGTLKVANHGPGRRQSPDSDRTVSAEALAACRAFLADTFPALASAPLLASRLCFYCDSFDGDFWIDHHPHRPGLVVAAGDSGHAFKFAPVLGALVADVVEQFPNPDTARFRWREPKPANADGARWRGDG